MWLRVRHLATALVILLMASACAADEAVPTTEDTGDQAGEVTTQAPEDEDTGSEQIVRYAPGLFPVSLNVYANPAEEATQTAVQQALEPLVKLEAGEPVPVLAESWETPNDLTWVFHLRDGVTFHDGTPFTAEDVKASAEAFIAQEGVLAPLWAPVESVEATDDLTVTITTSDPVGPLLSTLSLLFIGPSEGIGTEEFWQQPIGTGPFTIQEFRPDERVVFERYDAYWGEAPTLDRLEIVSIPEISAKITALQTGEVDIITSIPPDQVAEVSDVEGINYETGPSFTYFFVWFNHDQEPLDDVNVRRAMGHAINYEQIIPDLFGDLATVARAPIPQAVFGAPEMQPGLYGYDPDLARELLTEAGFENGFETSIMWPRGGGPNIRELAQAMVSAWAEIGVTVELRELERAQFLEDGASGNWHLRYQTNAVATGDAHYTLGRLYNCEAARLGYCNEELDAILNSAAETVDQEERLRLYEEGSEILYEDAVGIFPADISNNTAYRDGINGYVLPANGRPDFATVSVAG